MIQEYFIHNEKQYNVGTIVVVKDFNPYSRSLYNANAEFQYYDTDKKIYALKIYNTTHFFSEESFKRDFCGIKSEMQQQQLRPVKPKEWTFQKELEINGLLIAWIWYVFIMAVAIIFNDRIIIWIFASIIFFSYRKNKLKEAGYK